MTNSRTIKGTTLEMFDVVEIAGLGQFMVGQIIERGDGRVSVRLDRKFNSSMTLEVMHVG